MDEAPPTAWRDEANAYRVSPMKISRSAGLEPFNLGCMTVLTKELLKSSSAEIIVRNVLSRALAAELDRTLLDPSNTGTSGIKPASITAGSAVQDSPQEAFLDWGDTFQGNATTSWLVMNPWQAARLSSAARPTIGVKGGTLAGFGVVTSTAVQDGIFILIDPDQVALAVGSANIRASEQGAVEMQDSSTQSSGASPTATTLTSMWQTNSVAIIGSITANWRVVRADAVQVFDASAYGLLLEHDRWNGHGHRLRTARPRSRTLNTSRISLSSCAKMSRHREHRTPSSPNYLTDKEFREHASRREVVSSVKRLAKAARPAQRSVSEQPLQGKALRAGLLLLTSKIRYVVSSPGKLLVRAMLAAGAHCRLRTGRAPGG